MKRSKPIKLLSEVRDLQVVDSEGRKCGIVDDIEFAGGPGRPLTVKALLIGPGAWKGRLPGWAYGLTRLIAGEAVARVPWTQVDHVTSRVFLRKPAAELGLMRTEARFAALFSRIAG